MSNGSRYVKAPQPSDATRPLYEATLRVLSGEMEVTEAAQSVGLSRQRFQTRTHRGLRGLLKELEPKPRGRRAMPEVEKQLRAQVAQLQREKEELTQQLEASARMMGVASEWMRKGLQRASRGRKAKATPETAASDADDDGPARCLEVVSALHSEGVSMPLAASAAGVSAPTARRWRQRRRAGLPMRKKRGPRGGNTSAPKALEQATSVLTRTRACIGAATLGRAVGMSRRTAGVVKAHHVTQVERERREGSTRVELAPGVVRGFDAMFVSGTPVLVSADAGVPYRTSIECVSRYDEAAVALAVARDFERHGAPWVLRCDRWKAHVAPQVMAVLLSHGVLLMHGPPHCPRFYGQLERQNREHRAWLGQVEPPLQSACDEMREAFNELVPRRTLGWKTSGEAWRARAEVKVDRQTLREEVEELTRRMQEQAHRVAYSGLYERLAIQRALINRGLLRLTKGGWC